MPSIARATCAAERAFLTDGSLQHLRSTSIQLAATDNVMHFSILLIAKAVIACSAGSAPVLCIPEAQGVVQRAGGDQRLAHAGGHTGRFSRMKSVRHRLKHVLVSLLARERERNVAKAHALRSQSASHQGCVVRACS